MDIQYLKGIGPAKAALFQNLEISTIADLLHYYPRTYQDRRPGNLSAYGAHDLVVFLGRVMNTQYIPARAVLIFKIFLENDNGDKVEVTVFKRRPSMRFRFDPMGTLKKDFKVGNWMWVVGKREDKESFVSDKITLDEYYPAEDKDSLLHVNRLTPIYGLTQGLTNKFFRVVVNKALETKLKDETESLPLNFVQKRKLLGSAQALKAIHFPANSVELDAARRRLVYEEFLLLTTAWGVKKRQTVAVKNYGYEVKKNLLTPFREALGFEFTGSQKKVINEIFHDMQSQYPMTRMLQGDVGSGKTIVALSAMLLAAENGMQSVMMAPTEILAEQHFLTVQTYLKKLKINVGLLTSSVKGKNKEALLKKLAEGEIDILIGTHAVIEDNVKFKNLKLAVIDEQHRFGVRQRTTLRNKAQGIDMLAMTATPIPRSLALAFYGDLEVSSITELPPGRKPITTTMMKEPQANDKVREELAKGRQAYIVYPLIDESEKLAVKAVKEDFDKLVKEFAPYKVGMLHGQMNRKDKESVMKDFKDKKIDVLVATPVIEVGIDVKNATVMVIHSAERFGLASLHQLRGRVGRGEAESFCILVPQNLSTISEERLKIITQTQDGFKIGERDMELRGPGEILGTRQSGEFEFKAGDLFKDKDVLKWAIEDRDELLQADPALRAPENKNFKDRLIDLYQKHWHLIDLS
ncbi:ATP-dependent DNA helicase RecG [Elusimicrobium posterum]|uniref:ATP-dependent DNA helicase RecG n=1 Tax=Elusimicrobium posterum TaxID=3116653 RepID=UPI003C79381E